jgi:hypothetical protein
VYQWDTKDPLSFFQTDLKVIRDRKGIPLCANVAETPASSEFSVEGGKALPHGQGREEREAPVARGGEQ